MGNVISRLFDFSDPHWLAQVRDQPVSMREMLTRSNIDWLSSDHWRPGGEMNLGPEFKSVDEDWLDRGQLFISPTPDIPEGGELVSGWKPPRGAVWLEGRYVDEERKEIAVFPELETHVPLLMLYAKSDEGSPSLRADLEIVATSLDGDATGVFLYTGAHCRKVQGACKDIDPTHECYLVCEIEHVYRERCVCRRHEI
ncbi:hypothetical protein OG859_18625 [Streptomyces sp. NBC_00048]|uniref:hypothetical protein n=1 Tax=Streptomyces sp. NBC_00048 TaxID=2975628 RepID=UPI00324E8B47